MNLKVKASANSARISPTDKVTTYVVIHENYLNEMYRNISHKNESWISRKNYNLYQNVKLLVKK